jgi:hypothetical protein
MVHDIALFEAAAIQEAIADTSMPLPLQQEVVVCTAKHSDQLQSSIDPSESANATSHHQRSLLYLNPPSVSISNSSNFSANERVEAADNGMVPTPPVTGTIISDSSQFEDPAIAAFVARRLERQRVAKGKKVGDFKNRFLFIRSRIQTNVLSSSSSSMME